MSSEQHEHNAFIRWKHTKVGRICWAILAGIIAYVFGSLAVDTGQLWQWGVALLFLGDTVYNIVQLVRMVTHRGKRTN